MKKYLFTVLTVLVPVCMFHAVQAQGSSSASAQQLQKQQAELDAYVHSSGTVVDSAMQQMLTKSFIIMHPDYYISLLKFRDLVAAGKIANAEKRFGSFSPELKQSVVGQEVAGLIQAQKIRPGQLAPDFISQTPDGKPIKLADLRGKYVFLDFWASWCHPCREESPNVLKAWQRFKDKNFEILSVSLDGNKVSWQNAIEEDGVGAWHHVSDLKAWQTGVVKSYMLTSVPRSFLLDPDGKIIAMDLRGSMLEEQLQKIFL
jgi:peroxiredoxin